MSTITGSQIDRFWLVALRGGIKAEKVGLRRKGKSALKIIKDKYGLHKSTTHDEAVDYINALLEKES